MWQTGSRAERIGYLAALRDSDPAAARDLLRAGWASETGDDRAELLPVLASGLSAADEEFLETALDDRKGAVRAAALRLLARLPGSAFVRRATARAWPLLRLEGAAPDRTLVASLPSGPDPAAARDGLAGRPPPPGISAAAWQLTQVIALVPLGQWAERFGLAPAGIVALPVSGELASHVHAGWRLAAVRQASPDWAAALLASGARHPQTLRASNRPLAAWPADEQLVAVLPPAARAARVAALLPALRSPRRAGRTGRLPGAVAGVAGRSGGVHAAHRGYRGARSRADVDLGRDAAAGAGHRGGPQPARHRWVRLRRRAEPAGLTRAPAPRPGQWCCTGWPARSRCGAPSWRRSVDHDSPRWQARVLRPHAEQIYAAELAALREADDRPRPPSWRLSPQAVVTYLLGGTLPDGTEITAKYIGPRRLIEVAVATLATDRALLLLGLPGTAKTWVSEHLAAAVSGDSACWCRAPRAPPRRRSGTAGTTRGCWPRGRAGPRWCRRR